MFFVPVTRDTRTLSRLFDDTFDRFFGPPAAEETQALRSPALDVVEAERQYTVKLDMPGVTQEDVKVSIDGRQVTVQAETQRTDEKKEGDRVVYRERAMSSYARTFTLPTEIDPVESGAKLENGVLTLTLPKRASRTAAQVRIS